MENSLYEAYKECRLDSYHETIYWDNLFGTNGHFECQQFISSYFVKARKAGLFDLNYEEKYESDGKHEHSVSLFFMCCLLNSPFEKLIRAELAKQLDHKDAREIDIWYKYDYICFLTCLYHDVGSCIEKSTNNTCTSDVLYDYLKGRITGYFNGSIAYNVYRDFQFMRFPEEIICNYFRFKKNERNELDHGIICGYQLYDLYMKSFNKYVQAHKEEYDEWGCFLEPPVNDNNISIFFHRDLPKVMAVIADAIICHNIWLAPESNREMYENYGLMSLMQSGPYKLDIKKNPLQYLLCMADTIEPCKRFCDPKLKPSIKPRDILENISINNISDDGFVISWTAALEELVAQSSLQAPNPVSGAEIFKKWKENIIGMNDWMVITAEPEGAHTLIVKFSQNEDNLGSVASRSIRDKNSRNNTDERVYLECPSLI